MRAIKKRKEEEVENRKFYRTAITRESFLEWRAKFKKEIEEKERIRREEKEANNKKRRVRVEKKKLTGRQLQEKGIVEKVDEDELESEDALEAVEKFVENGEPRTRYVLGRIELLNLLSRYK